MNKNMETPIALGFEDGQIKARYFNPNDISKPVGEREILTRSIPVYDNVNAAMTRLSRRLSDLELGEIKVFDIYGIVPLTAEQKDLFRKEYAPMAEVI